MSNLYRPSKWVRDEKTGKMVRSNPGQVFSLKGKAKIRSGLLKFGT